MNDVNSVHWRYNAMVTQVAMGMIGRLLILLAAIAMTWCSLPPEPCLCSVAGVKQASAEADHSCCSHRDQEKERCSHSQSVANRRRCCGAFSNELPALVSDLKLSGVRTVVIEQVTGLVLLSQCSERFAVSAAQSPRAPPDIPGMGSSRTYLYKRSFLI